MVWLSHSPHAAIVVFILSVFFNSAATAVISEYKWVNVTWGTGVVKYCNYCPSPSQIYVKSPVCTAMPDEYVLSFEDQLPGAAVLTTSTASVVGAFNCNPGGDISQQSIRVLLNDNYVDGGPIKTPNSMGCWCPNCGTPITVQLSEKVMKAQYFKGQQNHISICLTNNLPGNFLCLGEVDMKVYFKVSEPRVTSVVPLFGPASGGTVITVGGDNFSPSLETECLFGGKTRTKATIISDTKLQCSTPNGVTLNTTSFGLVIKVLENEYTFSSKFLFKFYKGGEISGVTPRKASHKTSTRIRVFGQFEETGMYRCRFSSHSATRTVGGTLSDDGSTITCYAPTWNKKETVNLTISLNDQQYSKPYKFRFASKYQLNWFDWTSMVLGALILVIAVALVVVWFRHRHYLDGYDRIKEGNTQVDLNEIQFGERIGRGTFGEVYKGMWRGAVVAVKKLNTAQMNEEFIREYEKEVYLMRTLRAPNVLQFLGSTFNPPDICIVMEYMSRGSLYEILHNPMIVLEWPLLLRMLADTARGMTYLHTCKPPVIHRDLKSHNLLIDEFWKVKVSDFGLSTFFEQASQTMTACGTPCWTAPEVLRHLHYTVKADVYSFGIVMWECVTRHDPYGNMPPFKVIYAVGNQGLRPNVPVWVPAPYAQLMKRCWSDNMDMRPEFSAILDEIEELSALGWTGQPGPSNVYAHEGCSSGSMSPQFGLSGADGMGPSGMGYPRKKKAVLKQKKRKKIDTRGQPFNKGGKGENIINEPSQVDETPREDSEGIREQDENSYSFCKFNESPYMSNSNDEGDVDDDGNDGGDYDSGDYDRKGVRKPLLRKNT